MPKSLKDQEGSQGSKEDMELKENLAKKVNQGADLLHPEKVGEGMADINKGTDAEKANRFQGDEAKADEKADFKADEKNAKK